jgi:hypothetical protein
VSEDSRNAILDALSRSDRLKFKLLDDSATFDSFLKFLRNSKLSHRDVLLLNRLLDSKFVPFFSLIPSLSISYHRRFLAKALVEFSSSFRLLFLLTG